MDDRPPDRPGALASERRTEFQEFIQLARRYRRLAWPANVAEQRERDRLNRELMRLYLRLYPNAPYREWDDFDAVSRGNRDLTA
jgi:hypothetical protein